jgi:hypothetical protein
MSDPPWPKPEPTTSPKTEYSTAVWKHLAEVRAAHIADLSELVKILEARIAHLEKLVEDLGA